MAIIKSMLDTDLYTLTVMYFYMQKMPRAIGEYTFFDRNKMVFPKGFAEKLANECKDMESLYFTDSDIKFLKERLYFLPPFFFDYLRSVKFDASMLNISQSEEGHLHVTATGPLYKSVIWEVPLLATISELYYKTTDAKLDEKISMHDVYNDAYVKGKRLIDNGLRFSEFGTRRRASYDVQREVIEALCNVSEDNELISTFSGTSNLLLAKEFNLRPIGTMSHQLVSAVGALFGVQEANYLAMEWWQDIYNADLGIFLADTYTTDVFIKNFSKLYAKLYDGTRQDSGCPFEFTDKIVKRYCELGINPKAHSITYSDGLNVDKAIKIHEYAKNYVNDNYGIGTHFTNDIKGIKPCNIVMKLTRVKLTENSEWKHCIKLSDSKGKYMGDEKTIEMAKHVLNID